MSMYFFWFLAVVIFLGDQLIKKIIRHTMFPGQTIPVWPDIFHLTFVLNPGAAFGLLPYQTNILVAVAVVLLAGMIIGYRYLQELPPSQQAALALIAGGALGNLIDRVRWGLVIDYLDFRVWPVFNLADVAICTGAFLLFLQLWGRKHAER